jgi:hypothetical protein
MTRSGKSFARSFVFGFYPIFFCFFFLFFFLTQKQVDLSFCCSLGWLAFICSSRIEGEDEAAASKRT